MADHAHLLWAAWRCLRHVHRTAHGVTGVVVEPVEVLHSWHLCNPCDELLLDRFKECVATSLPWGQPGDPEGLNVDVRTNRGDVELWAGWDEVRPDETRPADAKGATVVALLRQLMAADEPPPSPSREPCPVCKGKRSIGPVHVNRGRQPHEWVTIPCHRCVGPAEEPVARLAQAVVEQATTPAPAPAPAPAAAPAAAPTAAPKNPAPAAKAGQMTLF